MGLLGVGAIPDQGADMISMQMKGFEKIIDYVGKLPDRMQRANAQAATKLAKESARFAKDLIRAQVFEGASVPLDPKYEAQKDKNNDLILIHTRNYIRLIDAHPKSVGGWQNDWTVGVLRGTRVGTTDYGKLAQWLEEGTTGPHGMPARPMWKQVEDYAAGRFDEVVYAEYKKAGLLKGA